LFMKATLPLTIRIPTAIVVSSVWLTGSTCARSRMHFLAFQMPIDVQYKYTWTMKHWLPNY
jgi:hypothetical protein